MFRAARWRLVAWNVIVLSCILLALSLFVFGYFYSTIYQEVDKQLQSQQSRFERYIAFNGLGALSTMPADLLESGYHVAIADPHLRVIMSAPASGCYQRGPLGTMCPPPQATDPVGLQAVYHTVMTTVLPPPQPLTNDASVSDVRTVVRNGVHVRVRSVAMYTPLGWYFMQIDRSVEAERAKVNDLRTVVTYGSLLGILLSAAGSLFLANRALVPIRQAFSRQRQFTADASHELRTPLSLIRANAEMLARHADRLAPEDGEMVVEILRETDHLNQLVSDLLTLARADAGTPRLAIKPVDLRALVEEVHEDVALVANSRGITSTLSLDGPVQVMGDEVRLRQLVLILLDNALKYTDTGGSVTTQIGQSDGRARLTVADTGIGIPAEDVPHVFDRFYRVDRAREHESGGTGLGLAIAQWIVQAHRGIIKVDSDEGKGSRFQVELPAS